MKFKQGAILLCESIFQMLSQELTIIVDHIKSRKEIMEILPQAEYYRKFLLFESALTLSFLFNDLLA